MQKQLSPRTCPVSCPRRGFHWLNEPGEAVHSRSAVKQKGQAVGDAGTPSHMTASDGAAQNRSFLCIPKLSSGSKTVPCGPCKAPLGPQPPAPPSHLQGVTHTHVVGHWPSSSMGKKTLEFLERNRHAQGHRVRSRGSWHQHPHLPASRHPCMHMRRSQGPAFSDSSASNFR